MEVTSTLLHFDTELHTVSLLLRSLEYLLAKDEYRRYFNKLPTAHQIQLISGCKCKSVEKMLLDWHIHLKGDLNKCNMYELRHQAYMLGLTGFRRLQKDPLIILIRAKLNEK